MAGIQFTTPSQPISLINFNGGLNSTAGPLSVKPEESSDLHNIDFDKFGSILKRSGYRVLSDDDEVGANQSDGLHWYEFVSAGAMTRYAINICGGKVYYMDSLDGTWLDISGSVAPTATNHCDFENFNNIMFGTNGVTAPFQWNGTGNAIKVPCFTANSYTFTVSGVTTAPSVGRTYTNNAVTFTVTYQNLTGSAGNLAGSVIATGSGIPEQTGTLASGSGGSGDSSIDFSNATANANITSAKFVRSFNNFLFWGNVVVGTDSFKTRIYWTNLKDNTAVSGDSWIEVGLNDGQEIAGLQVLADRLVVYKERSIYNVYYTGDADIPFIMPGGGKSTSNVGCVAPWSIQEINNGHVFLAPDGLYYYDGSGSTKLSYRISNTLLEFNSAQFANAVSTVYKVKNKYYLSFCTGGHSTADRVIIWDWFNNAFSLYTGLAPSAMMTAFVDGYTETPYFADYSGYTYQMEYGSNDNPLGVETAIDAYFYTNWRSYDDLCDQKGIPNVYIYYQVANTVLTFAYSYDFENADQFTQSIALFAGTDVYGTGLYGTAVYAGAGGGVLRRDLTGRGRVVRFKFANSSLSENFRIDALGTLAHLETNV